MKKISSGIICLTDQELSYLIVNSEKNQLNLNFCQKLKISRKYHKNQYVKLRRTI